MAPEVALMSISHSASPKTHGIDTSAPLKSERYASSFSKRQALQDLVHSYNELFESKNNNEVEGEISAASHGQRTDPLVHQWNARQDTIYAHEHPSLSRILHIFHSGWHGIRAAAGSLPGMKLAIPDALLSLGQMKELIEEILSRDPLRIIFHGVSDNTFLMIQTLAARGLADHLFIVFHGSPMMWHADQERRYAYAAIELKKKGKIKSLQFMKAELEIPGVDLYAPMLFNMSPRVAAAGLKLLTKPLDRVIAFLPGWRLVHKNIFVSAIGAGLSSRVDEIQVLAPDLHIPAPASEKVRRIVTDSRDTTFTLYAAATFSLNISIIDCHPMVNVESQACGRPCLRGRLFLDALEDHEYVKHTTVENPSSTIEIKNVIDRLLSIGGQERREMTLDYQKKSDAVAIARYQDFLRV